MKKKMQQSHKETGFSAQGKVEF